VPPATPPITFAAPVIDTHTPATAGPIIAGIPRRFHANIEPASLQASQAPRQPALPHGIENAIDIYHSLARAFSEYCDEFTRLQRRVDSTHRQYRNTLHELERLQAEESAPETDPEPHVTSCDETSKPQNGFDPQNQPDASIDPPPPLPHTLINARRDPPLCPSAPAEYDKIV